MPRARSLVLPVAAVAVAAAVFGLAPPARADELLRTLAETRGFSLGQPGHVVLTPDGKSVLYLRTPPQAAVASLYELDVASGKERLVASPETLLAGKTEGPLSPEERARRERMRVSTRGFADFQLSDDGRRLLLPLAGRAFVLDRASGRVAPLPDGAPIVDPRFSRDGARVAYVRERDLYVAQLEDPGDAERHRGGPRERRLTKSAHPRVSNGLAEFIAEEELDRFRGFWWSPDGQQLAYEEADSREVETFHLADVTAPERPAEDTPYPRPGKANAKVRLGLIPSTGGATTWVSWDTARFPYLASVEWRAARAPLTLVVLSRDQRDLEVLAVDAKTGRTRRLLAEHDDAWLDLDPSVPRWLPDGSGFLWSSERTGVRVLERHRPDGTLERALTSEREGYARLAHLDAGAALVEGSAEPTEQQVWRVPLDGRPPEALTHGRALHGALFPEPGDASGPWVLRTVSLEAPPSLTLFRGAEAGPQLPSVALAPPFVPRVELTTVGERGFRAALVRPRRFDPQRKYPVLVDVYGGPHHQQVVPSMLRFVLDQWYADHGVIVVAVDGRGTPGRGRAWERALAGSFAKVPLEDQVAGLKALGARYRELDLGRVGIVGWSFGGYLSALALLARPDVFHVAVAGAPVVDWRDYDTAYTERYLGQPEQNRAGYDESSLLTWAPRLERPLLVVHGTRDDNVYFFHTLKLCEALFRAGKTFELLPLPGLTHMVPDPSVREALTERTWSHLQRVLKP